MSNAYIELAWWQVAIAASLILINAVASLLLQLGLAKRLLVASVRMMLQLIMVGYVLQWIFRIHSALAVAGVVSLMITIAGISAVRRVGGRFQGIYSISLLSVWGSSMIVSAVGVAAVVQPQPWWQPQYLIPLLGMILGNALTGISLGLDRFLNELRRCQPEIDAALCLGATRWEAMQPSVQSAIRTGMIPILNAMSVAGVVSLPGMMTGQMLAGANPLEAVKYQIVIMFLIAATVALGTLSAVLLSYLRLTDPAHRIRWEKLL